MRVEKRFYTENAALWQRAEQKAEKEPVFQSGEFAGTEGQSSSLKEKEIMDQVQDDRKNQFHVIHGEKRKFFEKISQNAMELAEEAPFDIVVETGQYSATISLSADTMMILPSSPLVMKEAFAELIREAESTTISVGKNGMLEMNFVFSFTSDIPRRGRS